MTHWRTSRQTVGGNQPGGSPHDARNTSVDSSYLPAELPSLSQPNSRADDFNLGAGLLFWVLFLGTPAVVGGVAFAYLTLAPRPTEYARGVEAYRFKGH